MKWYYRAVVTIAVALWATSGPAAATPVSGSIADVGTAVTVISRDDISTHGYRTLADVLQSVRGFYAIDDRNYGYMGVRGVLRPGDYGSRTLLLVNGHRYNGNVYGATPYGDDFGIDLSWVERVEVAYGPGSAANGPNAALAVVNVVTIRGAAADGMRGRVNVDENGYAKAALAGGKRFPEGVDAFVSGFIFGSPGRDLYFAEFDDPTTNDGLVNGNADAESGYATFFDVAYGELSFMGAFNSRTKHIPTGAYGSEFNQSGTKTVDGRNFAVARYVPDLGQDRDLLVELAYDQVRYDGDWVYALDPVTLETNKDKGRGDWLTLGAHWEQQTHPSNRLRIGGEAEWNVRTLQQNWDEGSGDVYVDNDQTVDAAGAYVEDVVQLPGNGSLRAGVRFDRYDGVGEHFGPRAGLEWPLPANSTARIQYNEAFRSPRPFELGFDDGVPNPDLNAELFRTVEGSWEVRVAPQLSVSMTAYQTWIEDMIALVDIPAGLQFQNLDKVRSRGLEWDVRGRLGVASTWGSLTAQKTEDLDTERRLTNSPAWLYQAGLAVPAPGRWADLAFRVRGMSSRRTLAGSQLDGHAVASVAVSTPRTWAGPDVTLLVDNVLDEEYADPGNPEHPMDTIPQSGRSVRVTVGYHF